MSIKLEIQILESDVAEIQVALQEHNISASKLVAKHFDGNAIASLLVELNPQILSFLAGLYVARINAQKHIVYKCTGLEIKGVSESTLLKIYKMESEKSYGAENGTSDLS